MRTIEEKLIERKGHCNILVVEEKLIERKGHCNILAILGVSLGMLTGQIISHMLIPTISAPKNTNPLYLNPVEVVFRVEDANKDEKKTIMDYKGEKYLVFHEAKLNKIILLPYGENENQGGK